MLTEDGQVWTLSGYTTRIHQELARVNPGTGDDIGWKFLGVVERAGKKAYPDVRIHNYSRPAVGEVSFASRGGRLDMETGTDGPADAAPDVAPAGVPVDEPSREVVDGDDVAY